ncbi:Osiris 16 [Danaus plexippus plexippus]|uniref:Osiris 16 n=1 Tax=Danaus plexippus plexippus TaxID=278856 RepID=A0A212F1M8_DANPL|nr:Osiris 16 [Danaus plexippus plexippus]
MYKLCILVLGVASALPNPRIDHNTAEPTVENAARAMGKDCSNGIFSATCLKIEAISVLEKLSSRDELNLLPGISVVKESKENDSKAEEFAADLARAFPSKPEERLDKYLLYRLGSYLDNHSVKLRLMDSGATEEARAMMSEGRGKGDMLGGGKKGGMGGLVVAAMMMKSTLMTVGLGALALLAGKALMTAMMSLLLSGIIGLKSLSGGGKSTTYEVISKPIYTHSHSHSTSHEDVGGYGHSGYGRSLKVQR